MTTSRLKALVRSTSFYYLLLRPLVQPLRDKYLNEQWLRGGLVGPPSPAAKRGILRSYGRAFGVNTLIETGTLWGDTVSGCRHDFANIESIELGDRYARLAQRRFRNSNIRIYHGDSSSLLRPIVQNLTCRALFWLDAHYVDPTTPRGDGDTPCLQELAIIMNHHMSHVVLIDDARCFDGTCGYPTVEHLVTLVKESRHKYKVEVLLDIIRLTPTGDSPSGDPGCR
jgi:hypothetical protein